MYYSCIMVYNGLVQSWIDYFDIVTLADIIQQLQIRAARIVGGSMISHSMTSFII